MIIIREKYILILGKGLTQGLDNSTIITDVQYSIDYTESKKIFLSLHYKVCNSCL